MSDDSRRFQSLSVAILAITTTAPGLGIFAGYLRREAEVPSFDFFAGGITSIIAMIYYAILAMSASNILLKDEETRLTGRDIAHGPAMWMMQIMGCAAMMLVLDVVSAFGRQPGHASIAEYALPERSQCVPRAGRLRRRRRHPAGLPSAFRAAPISACSVGEGRLAPDVAMPRRAGG